MVDFLYLIPPIITEMTDNQWPQLPTISENHAIPKSTRKFENKTKENLKMENILSGYLMMKHLQTKILGIKNLEHFKLQYQKM
jgi:hypothetical protein